MSRLPGGRPALPSLIDRLSRASGGDPAPIAIEEIRAGVIRDLEWLLNSRRVPGDLPSPLEESLLAFGLPDLSAARLDEPRTRTGVRDAILDAIRRFEPRLTDVRVEVEESVRPDRRVRFRIEGILRVEPEPQPFRAEPLLDLATRAFVLH